MPVDVSLLSWWLLNPLISSVDCSCNYHHCPWLQSLLQTSSTIDVKRGETKSAELHWGNHLCWNAWLCSIISVSCLIPALLCILAFSCSPFLCPSVTHRTSCNMLIICHMEGLSIMCSVHPVDSAAVRNLSLKWCRGLVSAPHALLGGFHCTSWVCGWLTVACRSRSPEHSVTENMSVNRQRKEEIPSVFSWAALTLLSSTAGLSSLVWNNFILWTYHQILFLF